MSSIVPSIFATEWAPSNLQSEKYLLSLDSIFAKVKSFGCDFVHLVYCWNFDKDDVATIETLIERYNVHVSCVHSLTQLNRPNSAAEIEKERVQLSEAITIAGRFGAALVACNFGQNASRTEEAAIADCKTNYASCFDAAADSELTIVVENTCSANVGDEITTSAEGILRLIEGVGTPSFKFQFDPGNLQSMGEQAYPYAYELLKEHVRFIHLKDVVKYDGTVDYHRRAETARKLIGTNASRYVTVPVGEGEMDLVGLIGNLIKDGYKGFIDVEPHTVEDRLDEFYTAGLNFLSRYVS